MCEICCELSSSETMYQLNERAVPPCQCLAFQTSEVGDTHVYLLKPVAPTPRSEPIELQNLLINSAVGLSQNVSEKFLT